MYNLISWQLCGQMRNYSVCTCFKMKETANKQQQKNPHQVFLFTAKVY